MNSYSVSITINFQLEAPNEEKALERAEEVKDTITVGKKAKWFDSYSIEFGWPDVEEA